MNSSVLNLSVDNHIAHIQLTRPEKRNAMGEDFWRDLPATLRQLDREAAARVIVISSTGPVFSAGIDLNLLASVAQSAGDEVELGRKHENLRRMVLELQETFNVIEKIRIPVLVAIQGGCIGGAIDMVSACDMRYCTEDAYFCIEEINVGMTADLGTLQRLPHLIPQGVVRELAYTGRKMPAQEAKGYGLVNRVYANQATMLDEVMTIAGNIASKSPLAIAGSKEMITYARDHSVADSLNMMSVWQSGMFQQQDVMESVMAKMQKREPNFDELCPAKPLFEKGEHNAND